MLFERQKCLLALVDALGGDVGSLDFQKLLFLYCQEVEATPSYEFVPYRFGGFSFTSYADKRRLIEQGLLADEERCWRLTAEGRAMARVASATRVRMDHFARRHASLRGDALGPASPCLTLTRPDPILPPLLSSGLAGMPPIHFRADWPPRRRPQGGRHREGTNLCKNAGYRSKEIAARLGVNRETIYKWLAHKNMPAHKVAPPLEIPRLRAGRVDQTRKEGANRVMGPLHHVTKP